MSCLNCLPDLTLLLLCYVCAYIAYNKTTVLLSFTIDQGILCTISCYSLLPQSMEADTLWRSYLAMGSVLSCSITSERFSGWTEWPKINQNKPWRDVDGINVTDGSWCRLPVCLAGSAVSQWTSRWCTSTPRWRLTTTWTTPSWPSAATESPSKARGAVLSVSQTQKQCVEIHQLEMWLCKKTETVQLYVTLWPPLIGNIETKHTMAPSVKSRNNVLR